MKKKEISTKLTQEQEENHVSPTFGHRKSIIFPNQQEIIRNYSCSTHKKEKENIEPEEKSNLGVLKCPQGH